MGGRRTCAGPTKSVGQVDPAGHAASKKERKLVLVRFREASVRHRGSAKFFVPVRELEAVHPLLQDFFDAAGGWFFFSSGQRALQRTRVHANPEGRGDLLRQVAPAGRRRCLSTRLHEIQDLR